MSVPVRLERTVTAAGMQFWNMALPVLSGSLGVGVGGYVRGLRPMQRDRGYVPSSPLSQGVTPAPANAPAHRVVWPWLRTALTERNGCQPPVPRDFFRHGAVVQCLRSALWQRRDHDDCEATRDPCNAPLRNRPGAALSTGKCAHFKLELTIWGAALGSRDRAF